GSGTANLEANLNRRYIKKKLEHGLTRIWQDVQQKVKTYLLGTDLAYFKFDDFLHVLNLVNRLMEIGEEFCGSKSEGLQDSIRQQSANYFKNYHRARMDELRMFLENEAWELCPVKSSFSILNLQEFKFLRKTTNLNTSKEDVSSPFHSPSKQQQQQQDGHYFIRFSQFGNPFEMQIEEDDGEDVMATNGYESDGEKIVNENEEDSDDSDIPDELKQDYVDEQTGELPLRRNSSLKGRRRGEKPYTKSPPPLVTNTTLNALRFFGKYMQMMRVLKSVAFDVTICMSQLFDYYLFAVYSFFANNL
ncbi:syndetin-like, partial [Saccoglossus kowalevskii]